MKVYCLTLELTPVVEEGDQFLVALHLLEDVEIGSADRVMVLLLLFDRIITIVVGADDAGQVVHSVRGIPVPVEDDLPAGIGNVFIWRGDLPSVFVQSVEDRCEDENIEEDNDDQRRFAQRLAVKACEIRFDIAESAFHRSEHTHDLLKLTTS